MNRAFGFLLSVPLLFVAIFLLLVIHNVKQEEMQFEEYVLKFAIDYSTDAAVEEMLNMSHLGQDYTDQGRTNSDPQVALDTFLRVQTAYGKSGLLPIAGDPNNNLFHFHHISV